MSLRLHWEEIPPSGGGQGCVITLHGRGTSGQEMMPLADQIHLPRLRWVFPDGPMPFPGGFGGRMWYESPTEGPRGIEASRDLLFELLDHLITQDMVPEDRVVLMGFSQGAVMSLDVGLRYPRRLAGIIALSGHLAVPDKLSAEKSDVSAGMPVLLVHGKLDEVVSVEESREAQAMLRKEGYRVRLNEFLMAHQIIPDEIEAIRRYLVQLLDLSEQRTSSKEIQS
jgi:phospholipase/carboxylesterase